MNPDMTILYSNQGEGFLSQKAIALINPEDEASFIGAFNRVLLQGESERVRLTTVDGKSYNSVLEEIRTESGERYVLMVSTEVSRQIQSVPSDADEQKIRQLEERNHLLSLLHQIHVAKDNASNLEAFIDEMAHILMHTLNLPHALFMLVDEEELHPLRHLEFSDGIALPARALWERAPISFEKAPLAQHILQSSRPVTISQNEVPEGALGDMMRSLTDSLADASYVLIPLIPHRQTTPVGIVVTSVTTDQIEPLIKEIDAMSPLLEEAGSGMKRLSNLTDSEDR